MSRPGTRRVVLGDQAPVWRRRLGPSAWGLLETLTADAIERDGRLVVVASVRSLAASMGVGHNTVDRALHRLRAAGLVHSSQARGERGAFGRGSYVLDVPVDVLHVEHAGSVHRTAPKAPTTIGEQLSFLDADGVEQDVGGVATVLDRQVPTGRQ